MSGLVYIVDEDNTDGRLFMAVLRGDLSDACTQIRKGGDVNWRGNRWGNAPLHLVAEQGSKEAIQLLIDAGADIELSGCNDMTPLMVACHSESEGAPACVRLLIEAGANVNAERGDDNMTPLKFAVHFLAVTGIEALLQAGARIDGIQGDRFTPLMHAARHNNAAAIELLVRGGANVSVPCGLRWALGLTAEKLAWLEKQDRAIAAFQRLRAEGVIA